MAEPGSETLDEHNVDEVVHRMVSAVASKQYGQEGILCPLIAEASTSFSLNCQLVRVISSLLLADIHVSFKQSF